MAPTDPRPSAVPAALPAATAVPVLVVMGVCGCGKSTLGQGLAQALGLDFLEGDAFHPPRNVALMAAGTPLTDADRAGWLQALAERLAQARTEGRGVVLACSALKRIYRERLREGAPRLRLVWPHADEALLAARMAARQGHYMPPSLLPSQLAILEAPGADEACVRVDAGRSPQAQLADALEGLDALDAFDGVDAVDKGEAPAALDAAGHPQGAHAGAPAQAQAAAGTAAPR